MPKVFKLALVLTGGVLFPLAARAQFTTVTATVTDPNGIPYAGATMNATLTPGGGSYQLGGQPYSGQVGPITLDSAGKFTAQFGDVTLITPGSPQWKITITMSPGIPGPFGTGPQSFIFTSSGTTISGSSPVSLSSALNALASKLTNFSAGTGTITGTGTNTHLTGWTGASSIGNVTGSDGALWTYGLDGVDDIECWNSVGCELKISNGPGGTGNNSEMTPGSVSVSNGGNNGAAISVGTLGGVLTLNGNTSGQTLIGAPAIAGSPCILLVPAASPTAGQFLQSAAPSGSPSACQTSWQTGAVFTVATDGTGNFNATGTADQVPIQNAINAANSAGGGYVYIKEGVYNFTACVTPKNNVSVYGAPVSLTGFDGQSNDYWTAGTGGTWLKGDGTEVGFCANNTTGTAAGYNAANALSHAEFRNLGFSNFTRAFDIGAQNNPGAYWCVFKNLYITSSTDWGLHLENFSESYFEQIHSVSNTTGDMWFAATVNQANYQPGNSEFHQLYASPLNNLARGIVFAAPGSNSNAQSGLNSIKVNNLQVNRFRDTLTTQTITPTNASTAISVTDLTKFAVGMPFWVTSTADGYTANQMYFVLTVSGSSGAGTITAGNSPTTAAITANAGTALTLNSYGFANLEIAGSQSTASPSSVNITALGLDLEGNSGAGSSMLIFDERGNANHYQTAIVAMNGGPSAIVMRNSVSSVIDSSNQLTTDIDANSSSITWQGTRGTMRQRNPRGIFLDAGVNAWGMNLTNPGADIPDLYVRAPSGGSFWFPAIGIGEDILTRDTTFTLTPNFCGVVTFNGAASQTLTLPAIDNASTKNASLQGCRFKIVNASQSNSLAIATSSSQTFNNISGATSITMQPATVLEVTASTTGSGSVLYWSTLTSENLTIANCSSSASPAVCASADAGSVVIAAAATTVTVNTTAVSANSQILLQTDDTLGTKLGVTCNSTLATLVGGVTITARTAGTSFQITSGATPAVNPLCISYRIVN